MVKEAYFDIGCRVTVTVESIFDFGIFVRLDNGARGYIRRRNLSLSGEDHPSKIVSKGQFIFVEVIEPANDDRILELSLKDTLQDPWCDPKHKVELGEITRCRVKRIVRNGVIVEIVPGLDGFIHHSEMAPWDISNPEDFLWIDDMVEAMVIQVNRANRVLRLSIKQRIKNINKAEALLNYLQKSQSSSQREKETSPGFADPMAVESDVPLLSVNLQQPILIVEDSKAVRQSLIKWLENIKCTSVGVGTYAEAIEIINKQKFGALLVDVDLPDGNGIQWIAQIRKEGIDTPAAIMSGAEAIEKLYPELSNLQVSAVFPKPINSDDVLLYLHQLSIGEVPTLTDIIPQPIDEELFQPFRKLSRSVLANRPLKDRFRHVLENLVEQSQAELGVIFHLNSQDNRINLSAIVGDMKTKDNALPGLIASPVRDVIVDGNIVWEKNVTERNWGRFKKLLCYLRFESCIGVPVEAALHCEHALFLFHRKIDAFSRYRIRDTLASATLLSLALESSYLNRRIINLNSILLSGQLSAAFSHEVFNKVQGLDYQFKNLKIDYDKVLANNQNGESNSQAKKFDLALNDASGTVSGLVDTVTGFRRLIDTREELTEISINDIVLLASREIQQLADKHDIEVSLILEEHLPGAYGSQFGFYRVLLNLMLNAIQHMAQKPTDHHRLTVKTYYEEEAPGQEIIITVSDTGPGIHKKHLEHIFNLGFTTRDEGSGLGLYIANSLIESFGGKLIVKESIIPLGTEFLIELQRATLVTN